MRGGGDSGGLEICISGCVLSGWYRDVVGSEGGDDDGGSEQR